MSPSLPVLPHSLASSLLDLSTFGEVTLPSGHAELTFQMDIVPSECPEEFWFGILATDESHQGIIAGMAVRIDLARGEVWDAVNGMGLLGTLEAAPLGLERQDDDEEPFTLRLKVEKYGSNLLPSLEIGGSACLYPALSASAFQGAPVTAIAGAAQPGRDAEPFCHYPAYWLTQAA